MGCVFSSLFFFGGGGGGGVVGCGGNVFYVFIQLDQNKTKQKQKICFKRLPKYHAKAHTQNLFHFFFKSQSKVMPLEAMKLLKIVIPVDNVFEVYCRW